MLASLYDKIKMVMIMDDITKMMVDDDIAHSEDIWNKFCNDPKRMAGLFDMLIMRYKDIINGFSDDLEVISAFDSNKDMVKSYKDNVKKLIDRLKIFKECEYSNELLAKYYVDEGVKGFSYDLSFNETRKIITEMNNLNKTEINDILNKIDEIEEIVISVDTKKSKWEALRPYVVWTTGKDVGIAMLILPLIMKIN